MKISLIDIVLSIVIFGIIIFSVVSYIHQASFAKEYCNTFMPNSTKYRYVKLVNREPPFIVTYRAYCDDQLPGWDCQDKGDRYICTSEGLETITISE